MSYNEYDNYYRQSHRLKGFNYSSSGLYFITVCTKDCQYYFGKISNNLMMLTEFGKIARECWFKIPLHYPTVVLDEFIIMPNHMHGILQIIVVATQNFASSLEQDFTLEKTHNHASLRLDNNNKFGPQSKNLSSIVKGYKIGVKKYATMNKIGFFWQPRFYDRIIRNEDELNRIRDYIRNNPYFWKRDRNNKDDLFM